MWLGREGGEKERECAEEPKARGFGKNIRSACSLGRAEKCEPELSFCYHAKMKACAHCLSCRSKLPVIRFLWKSTRRRSPFASLWNRVRIILLVSNFATTGPSTITSDANTTCCKFLHVYHKHRSLQRHKSLSFHWVTFRKLIPQLTTSEKKRIFKAMLRSVIDWCKLRNDCTTHRHLQEFVELLVVAYMLVEDA